MTYALFFRTSFSSGAVVLTILSIPLHRNESLVVSQVHRTNIHFFTAATGKAHFHDLFHTKTVPTTFINFMHCLHLVFEFDFFLCDANFDTLIFTEVFMKRWKQNRYFLLGLTLFITFACCLIFYGLFSSFDPVEILSAFVGLLTPFFIGFAIAYLINPLMKLIEGKIAIPLLNRKKVKKREKLIRAVSVTFSILIAMTILVFLLGLLIPEAIESIARIIQKFPLYLNKITTFFDDFFQGNPDALRLINDIFSKIDQNVQVWLTSLATQIPIMLDKIASGVFGLIGWIKDFVLGIIISFYVLYNKEKFVSQLKKVLFAFLPKQMATHSVRFMGQTHLRFGGFITGVLIDSTLVGILCFIGVSLMQMPYALLISCLVGLFNIIPFLGPFLGGIPSAILILLESPEKTIWFILFMIVLQQFDGNIMNPKILGGTTGLPTFWVLFAIIIGGGLFGFLGMFLGVPVFSVIYLLISQAIDHKLVQKNLPTETAAYYHSKALQNLDTKSTDTKSNDG